MTCVAHLLRRASEMIADSVAGQARVPHAVRRLLRDTHTGVPALRCEHPDVIEGHAVEINPAGGRPLDLSREGQRPAGAALAPGGEPDPTRIADACTVTDATDAHLPIALTAERANLQARLDKLLAGNPTHDPNRKLLRHLANERDSIFTFLDTPGVQATNWRAEQAIRPAVVNRKSWGGNRTWRGADTQQVLMSVIRSARQQDADPVALLVDLQRRPGPAISPALTIPAAAHPQPNASDPPGEARGP